MTAQTYKHPVAIQRMRDGVCPECGRAADDHSGSWVAPCSLRPEGVDARIAWQKTLDDEAGWPKRTDDGRTVWACCVSSIGPACEHRTPPGDVPAADPEPEDEWCWIACPHNPSHIRR